MTRGLFLASPEARTGKSAVAVGLLDILVREVGTVGIFRPLVDGHARDRLIDVLLARPGVEQTYDNARGVTYEAAYNDPDEALSEILNRFEDVASSGTTSSWSSVRTTRTSRVRPNMRSTLGSPPIWPCRC